MNNRCQVMIIPHEILYKLRTYTKDYKKNSWSPMEVVLRFYIALRFPHKNNIRFVLAPFVCGRARLICIVCVCLRVVVSDTYCVMFFFILCTLCCRFLYNFDFPFGILTFNYFNFKKMYICYSNFSFPSMPSKKSSTY